MATVVAGRYDALFVDLDGVIYRGDVTVPGAGDVLEEVRRLGTAVLFITNNSARTPEEVAHKLARHGVAAGPEDVVTSGMATAALLRREGAAGSSAFVVGERGIRAALAAAGIEIVDGRPDRCDLVVVGWDRQVDYAKLARASVLVERGARLVATNADPSYPAPDGLWPGAGALLAVITTTTGARPTVVGKPNRPLFEAAVEATGASNPLMVGDRLDTDVGGANRMGWDSLLVLTGAARRTDLLRASEVPTYVAPTVHGLLEDTPPGRFRGAGASDGPALRRLLQGSGLTADGLEERLAGTVLSSDPESSAVDATACVDPAEGGGGFGVLRSVAVAPSHRRRGLGVLAVAAAIAGARRRGIRHVSLFTEAAGAFFEGLGFTRVDRPDLPEPVRAGRHATEECAISATPMTLDLEDGPAGRQ